LLSAPATLPADAPAGLFFERGDANADGQLDLADGLRALNFLFTNSTADICLKAADIDDSGGLELTDSVALFSFLFLGGAPPADPHLFCGPDLTPDDLTCDASLCPSADAESNSQFFVIPNGTECPSPPCFSLTARTVVSGTIEEISISGVLFDYVANISVSDETERTALLGQSRLIGALHDGPDHPRGEGKTLVPVTVLPDATGSVFLRAPDFFLRDVSAADPIDISIPLPFGAPVRFTMMSVSVRVRNLGRTSGSFDVELRLGGNVRKTWTVGNGLLGGKEVTLQTTLEFPFGEAPESFTLVANADPAEAIVEVLESNNRRQLTRLPTAAFPRPGDPPVALP